MINKDLIIKALISGIVWWFTYLYIRRYFNPENNGDIKKYELDGLYGGVAASASVLLTHYITSSLVK